MFNLCLILSLNFLTSSQAKVFQLGSETVDFYSPLPFFEKRNPGESQGSKIKTDFFLIYKDTVRILPSSRPKIPKTGFQ